MILNSIIFTFISLKQRLLLRTFFNRKNFFAKTLICGEKKRQAPTDNAIKIYRGFQAQN